MKHSMIVAAGVLVVVTWLLSAPASAGPIADDLNAMSAWQGTQQFYDTEGVATLRVDVEYAVYEPGHYGLSGADPSVGTQFVYAYQIFNDLGGNRPVSSFSVGLDPTANVAHIGSDAGSGTPGGTAPTASAFSGAPPTSAVWNFFLNTIDPPLEHSTVLLFTSPYGPRLAPASVMDSGLSDKRDLPSPMPEPATMMLLGIGSAMMAAVRRLRRRRRA